MRRIALFAFLLVIASQAWAGSGRMIIVNNDPAGQGFNDPTPVAPVGGNDGTTLGQQRLNVFRAAADRWETFLDTEVDIIVAARFSTIPGCTETDGILGQAGPARWRANFTGAPRQDVWYPVALANKLAGRDLEPTQPDINVQFNAAVDGTGCLGSTRWYYGLDRNHGTDIDLFVVVLHELGHGLGIAGAAAPPNFARVPGTLTELPAISDVHTIDLTQGLRWDQMNLQQRSVSIKNSGNLAWDGPHVREMAPRYLEPKAVLSITAPAAISGNYDVGLAAFGPPAHRAIVGGRVIQALDAADTGGPSTTDACSALSNSSALSGNVALIDRGSCTFVQKARNAQAAGAVGVVIIDNDRDACVAPGMGGTAADVTIPIVSISARDGDAIKAQLASSARVDATVWADPSHLAGTTREGYVQLYAPCSVEAGSSRHHWDSTATPNLLMEPRINSDLLHGVDLSIYQLLDMGWTLPPRTGRRILKR